MNGPDKRMLEREALRNMIQQWNMNRLDLFELSEPNEDLSFHGVMRFYFQDSGQKVATKCIRVASDATAADVIETLIEKFRPDMRMLSVASYALYELHSHEERRLANDEKPLLVQLNWHVDDREGRFLLRNIDDKTSSIVSNVDTNSNFKRKLSKREKKELKKKEKPSKIKVDTGKDEDYPVAEKLYTELPETSFTRSISNPEAVMRRRRHQKLEKKLQQFRSKDGGPDTGGTLKIYGESLCSDVPYKTLLLSINDCAASVVKEMLDKYGLGKFDPQLYCLVQVDSQDNSEYILDDDECPLAIVMTHPHRGSIMFHVRRRPADQPRRRKKKSGSLRAGAGGPCAGLLLETQPDGTTVDNGRSIRLTSDVVEVGSANGVALQLYGPSIQPRHCVIAVIDGVVTITPIHADAHTFINGQQIVHTTILQHGCLIKFGRTSTFRFVDPGQDNSLNRNLSQSQHFDSGSVYDRSPTSPVPDNVSGMMSPSAHSQMDVMQGSIETSGISDLHRAMSPSSNVMAGSQDNFSLSGYNGKHLRLSGDSVSTYNNKNHMNVDGDSMIGSNMSNSKGDLIQENFLPQHYNDMPNPQTPTHTTDSHNTPSKHYNMDYKDNYETTFDLDGNVETKSVCSIKSAGSGNDSRMPRGQEAILPAVLEFPEHTQQLFLHSVITELDVEAPTFKLAPVYTLYLCARYRASTHYRPELTPNERAHKLTALLQHVATLIQNTVQERHADASAEAFWLANGSELLHFLKSDRHICAFSTQAQTILANTVQLAFSNLVGCFHVELSGVLAQWLDEPVSETAGSLLLGALGSAMALLRRCRVNAALTIQLFSQLFHFINVWCFNKVVHSPHMWRAAWGLLLRERLAPLSHWAERQGLELAADCHLATIHQCAHLLQAPKNSVDEMVSLSSTCFKLNSVQLSCLLGGFTDENGRRLSSELVQAAVQHAQSMADELHRADGREITLEESSTLPLSLLIPEDGFSAEVMRGLSDGLADFLAPLQRAGLCRLAPQPHSQGHWTVYMNGHQGGGMIASPPQQPLVQVIKLHKNSNGMGLSIVAAKGAGQSKLGIYIKSVVAGGAAAADQRLQAGDQLLSVDGHSLVGISQERAAEFLVRTGPVVTLQVAKQGAVLHGLATLLRQPSPNRGNLSRKSSCDHGFSSSESSLNNACYSIPSGHIHHSECEDTESVCSVPGYCRQSKYLLYNQIWHREQCVDCNNYYSCQSDCSTSDCTESNYHVCHHSVGKKPSQVDQQTNTTDLTDVDDGDDIPYIDDTEPLIFEQKTYIQDNDNIMPSVRMLFSNSMQHLDSDPDNVDSSLRSFNIPRDNEHKNTYESSAQSVGIHSTLNLDKTGQRKFQHNIHLDDKDYKPFDTSSQCESSCSSKTEFNIYNNGNVYKTQLQTDAPQDNIVSNVTLSINNNDTSVTKAPKKIKQFYASPNKKTLQKFESKYGLGKVKALVGHFNELRLTYQARFYKNNSQSTPNLSDGMSIKCETSSPLVTNRSLCNISKLPSNQNDDKLSLEEQRLFQSQLENWWRHGTKAEDNIDFININRNVETKKGARDSDDNGWVVNFENNIDVNLIPSKIKSISSTSKEFGSLGKLTDTLKSKSNMIQCKSMPNINSKIIRKSSTTDSRKSPVHKKFPHSYIVTKKSTNKNLGKNFTHKPKVMSKSCRNIPNIAFEEIPSKYLETHQSCPNLGGNIREVNKKVELSDCGVQTNNQMKNVKDRPPTPARCPRMIIRDLKMKHPQYKISPRRMSERDLSSTMDTEQPGQHPVVKSSKSVPALHEVFNPGYSRTSSSNSIPTLSGLRNRPNQHNNDSNNFYQNLSTYKHSALHDRSLSVTKSPPVSEYHNATGTLHQPMKVTSRPQSAYVANPTQLSTMQLHAGYPSMPNVNDNYNMNLNTHVANTNTHLDASGGGKIWKQPPSPRTSQGSHPSHMHGSHPTSQQVTSSHPVQRSPYVDDSMNMNQPIGASVKQTPPVAPKPQGLKRGVSSEMMSQPQQQDVVDTPPLPPTATHPLYQSDEGASYLASSSEPPAVSLYHHAGVTSPPQAQALSNPWQREEREKELEARRLAAGVWRDKQINALQALGEENRTPQQEQQLRALTLERDFQRRAQEARTEDDEKNHENNDNTYPESENIIQQQKQEPIINVPQETKVLSPPVQPKSILKSNLRLDNLNSNSPQSPSKTQKNTSFATKPTAQSLKFDNVPKYEGGIQKSGSKYDHNVNNKVIKSEFSSTKYPEQMHKIVGKYDQEYSYNNLNSHNLSKFEQNISNNNNMKELSQNMSNVSVSNTEACRGEVVDHQGDEVYHAPPPPERGSSFAIMSHQQAIRSSIGPVVESVGAVSLQQQQPLRDKRVSFHHNSPPQEMPSVSTPIETTAREDPDKFIMEAESLLQSPTTPTSHTHTPGVIGAQEVYRDPRQRRLAEQQKAQEANSPIPEKLSFKEKMKMFALESGESNTPKDKVKISRAQRDIDAVH